MCVCTHRTALYVYPRALRLFPVLAIVSNAAVNICVCIPLQISVYLSLDIYTSILNRHRTDIFKLCMEAQKTSSSQNNDEKEKQSWRNLAI